MGPLKDSGIAMFNRPKGSFAKIARVGPDQIALNNSLHAFGIDDRNAIMRVVEDVITKGTAHPGYGGFYRATARQRPDGEPAARVMVSPGSLRSGVALTITAIGGNDTVEGLSVYFSDGVEYRFMLDEITLSAARGMGVLHGSIADGVPISVLEPTFAMDRCWHGAGSVHQILLYAVAHAIDLAPMPDLPAPHLPSGASPHSGTFAFADDFTALFPALEGPANLCGIQGVIKEVKPYELPVLGQNVTSLRMTMAKELAMFGKPLDVMVFVSDGVLGTARPEVGRQCYIEGSLCARLWLANVE
ncbi:MAG TPA: hypothetical protein PKE19_04740 [Aestuariivirga sp.]|mgnify:CR=1 FL=1|nr:hypothetical protein [Aestuariivirga sp.]